MKRYFLIIVLTFVATGMVVTRLKYQEDGFEREVIETKNLNTEIESEPDLIITPTEAVESEDEVFELDPDYPLWRSLPYYGKGYIVDRYVESLKLVVKIKGIDKEIVEEDVYEWIKENGVDPESHTIEWED